MKRFFLDEFKPISDQEPKIAEHFRTIIQDAMSGIMHPDDYTSELWKQLSPAQKDIQADLKREGDLVSMTLVDRRTEGSKRTYRYIMEFKNARALERFVLDEDNRIAMIQSDGSERKPDAPDEAPRF
jgi:hypothetical protein